MTCSVICEFLSYGKQFSEGECLPILIGSFGFPEHILCENFFPKPKKSLSTWETILLWGPTYPAGVGDETIRCLSILSDSFRFYTNMFQIKTFFPKLKTFDSTQKSYVGSFPPQKGQGWWYRLDTDLDWFFPVSRIHYMWKLKTRSVIWLMGQ